MRFALCVLLLLPAALPAQERTRSPHGELSVTCSACHKSESWTAVTISAAFRHDRTGMPLTGAHASANCRGCHESLDFQGTTTVCASCHRDTHLGELGADCSQCHSTRSFLDPAVMRRAHQLTRFPLAGAHLTTDCNACHTAAPQGQLQFVSRATDCQSCHLADYQRAQNPDHVNGGFPTDCAQCHAVTLWSRARFNHDLAGFALTGAHRATACNQCHLNGRFSGTPTTCVGCHQTDYDGTSNPNHLLAQFPTDCVSCHSTTSWSGAAFNHSLSGFPLTGAHKTTPCDQCHTNNRYTGTPTTCVACHQQDYDQTTNPGHQTAGFPTDCASCHTTAQWEGATFDHDARFFRIYSGKHRNQWASCATCHTTANDFVQFSCLTCHEHNKTQMDDTHRGKSGYQYLSTECLRCHPRV